MFYINVLDRAFLMAISRWYKCNIVPVPLDHHLFDEIQKSCSTNAVDYNWYNLMGASEWWFSSKNLTKNATKTKKKTNWTHNKILYKYFYIILSGWSSVPVLVIRYDIREWFFVYEMEQQCRRDHHINSE